MNGTALFNFLETTKFKSVRFTFATNVIISATPQNMTKDLNKVSEVLSITIKDGATTHFFTSETVLFVQVV